MFEKIKRYLFVQLMRYFIHDKIKWQAILHVYWIEYRKRYTEETTPTSLDSIYTVLKEASERELAASARDRKIRELNQQVAQITSENYHDYWD